MPPAVGSPSSEYHWRSTAVSGTPLLLQVNVRPKSSERATLKFAAVRSLKYTRPAGSTASSESPPPAHVVGLPPRGVAAGTHLNVRPPSSERQMKLVSEFAESGALM